MLQLLVGIKVNWMGRRHIGYIISGAAVLLGIISLVVHGGPRYGVDFTGGTLIEAEVTPPLSIDAVRSAVGYPDGIQDVSGGADARVPYCRRPCTLPPRMVPWHPNCSSGRQTRRHQRGVSHHVQLGRTAEARPKRNNFALS